MKEKPMRLTTAELEFIEYLRVLDIFETKELSEQSEKAYSAAIEKIGQSNSEYFRHLPVLNKCIKKILEEKMEKSLRKSTVKKD